MQGVMPNEQGQIYCEKCRRTMNAATNFYTYRDKSKCELCKTCLTMHVNNWEPETFLWILKKFNYPYIENEWNQIRDKEYQRNPSKVSGLTVMGKYMAKMHLRQYKDYYWSDTEKIAEEQARLAAEFNSSEDQKKKKIEQMREALNNGEITQAQFDTYAEMEAPTPSFSTNVESNSFQYPGAVPANSSSIGGTQNLDEEIEFEDVNSQLTKEDKIYLAMKWGRSYQPDEWVSLEKLYNEFMDSFDIQGAARLDTLKKICKTSLKMDQAIDMGDIESYQKLSRVYDSLMKSGKFQEQQRKEEKTGEFNSIGQIVAFAEKKKGKISRHVIDTPFDIVDKAIMNLKKYNRELVANDPSLSQMLENLVKRKEIVEQRKEEKRRMEAEGVEFLSVDDKDYLEFNQMLEMDKQKDKKVLFATKKETL